MVMCVENHFKFVFTILLVVFQLQDASADCKVSLKEYFVAPMLLKLNTGETNLMDTSYFPNANGDIVIQENTEVLFACPGEERGEVNMVVIDTTKTFKSHIIFKCKNNNFHATDYQDIPFLNIKCKAVPIPEIQAVDSCLGENSKFEVGFRVADIFYILYEGYYDPVKKATSYVTYRISDAIKVRHIGVPRVLFRELSCRIDNVICNDLYEESKTIETLNTLLNNPSAGKKYIKGKNAKISRGHLAAHSDFVFSYQQRATYYYDNVVPQWLSINCGIWQQVEQSIQDAAQTSLTVFTGSQGVSQLEGVDFYLYVQGNDRKVPVPKFVWKVLQNANNLAVAFVVSNNPYDEAESKSFNCDSVCKQITFLSKKMRYDECYREKKKQGVLHCCEVNEELRRTIPNIPNINVEGILTHI